VPEAPGPQLPGELPGVGAGAGPVRPGYPPGPGSGPGRRHRRRRRQPAVVFLREVPGDTPVHRMWAGTKLLAVGAVSLTLSFLPSWPSIGLGAAFGLTVALVARVPRSAVPRFPRGVYVLALVGVAFGLLAGESPYVHVGGLSIGLGALDSYARFAAVAVVLLGLSMLVGWTTDVGEVAPALATLWRPLRWVRAPVDEWATAVALCLRSVPLLVDELRTLVAARRLRPPPHLGDDSSGVRVIDNFIDLLVASLAVTMRRAGELGEAITARGGTPVVRSRRAGPGRADAVALALTVAVCVAAIAIDLVG
jgi:energy-coupling factor transport system permease protein